MCRDDDKVRKQLRDDIVSALKDLYLKDRELLPDRVNVCERCLMHRFTHYFIARIEGEISKPIYNGLSVDGEYNRQKNEPKMLRDPKRLIDPRTHKGRFIYPDIIVHKRNESNNNSNESNNNLCAIEIKKSRRKRIAESNVPSSDDIKLMKLTSGQWGIYYRYGVSIKFYSGRTDYGGFNGVTMQWFKDGSRDGELEKVPLSELIS